MTQPQEQAPELTPEQVEALEKLDGMVGTLGKSFRKMRDASAASLKGCKEALAFANDKIAEVEALRAQLDKKKGTPEFAYTANALAVMTRMFDGSRCMLEIQIAYDQKNLALAEQGLEMHKAAEKDPNAWVKLNESGLLADTYKFALPLEDVRYLEARAQMNIYLGVHHWIACVDGIDAILRATNNPPAVECQTPEEEAGRNQMAQVIREAAQANRDLAILLGRLGGELTEAWALYQWGSQALKAIKDMPAESKRQALADADWRKLNGKTVVLATLIDTVQPYAALAEFFPEPQAPEVPFDQLEWAETMLPEAPSGTGRLGTGRLGGSGQLGGTGQLGTGRLSTKPGPGQR